MSDRQAVLVAAVAAWWSPTIPWWWAAAGLGLALVRRRPWAVVLAAGLLAACLGSRAWLGDQPAPAGPFRASATLVDDPAPVGSAEVVEVRARGHHYEVWAHGRSAGVLRGRAAGQQVEVVGQVAPRPPGDDQAARRHVIGVITPDQVVPTDDGGPLTVGINRLRALLLAGGRPLSADQRSLYGGFVLGDVTGQSAVVADDFRGAGLSHLLVVSGENVAFVLAAAGPLLRRLGPVARWSSTVGVLVIFAAMTRFEPSVLRATVMAGLAVTAWSLGRRAGGVRLLALTVTALVLIDPMLVGVAGFQLSVAASAGIIVLARPLGEHLPLPGWLARPLGVTMAAQVAVSPILMAFYGGLPVATLPANLLAEPAAGLLMAWGLTAGAVAGLVGGPVAVWLQVPAGGLVWWVESVARWGAAAPLGQLGPLGLVLAAMAAAGGVAASRRQRSGGARVCWVVLVLVLAWPAASGLTARPAAQQALGRSGQVWTAGRTSVLVIEPRANVRQLLDGLRAGHVDRLDLVVSPSGSASAATLVAQLAQRVRVKAVWIPTPASSGAPEWRVAGASVSVPEPAGQLELGGLAVTVTQVAPRLVVSVAQP